MYTIYRYTLANMNEFVHHKNKKNIRVLELQAQTARQKTKEEKERSVPNPALEFSILYEYFAINPTEKMKNQAS